MPFGRRSRLMSDVGPDDSGSNPGFACAQMPEKSGMDSALPLWPEGKRHKRRRKCDGQREIPPLQPHRSPPLLSQLTFRARIRVKLHPLSVRLEGPKAGR